MAVCLMLVEVLHGCVTLETHSIMTPVAEPAGLSTIMVRDIESIHYSNPDVDVYIGMKQLSGLYEDDAVFLSVENKTQETIRAAYQRRFM